jgi:hypothetical protein
VQKLKLFGVILLALSVMSLQACQTVRPLDTHCIAVKPVLKSIQTNERGGISLDRDDTEALMIYIKQLQACAGVG